MNNLLCSSNHGGVTPMNFGWGCAAKVLENIRTKKAKTDILYKAQT